MQREVPKSKGITSGLGVCGFFAMLFESNELRSIRTKLTDEKIRELVLAEFPNRKSQFFSRSGVGITVNEYRNRYNKGVFTRGVPPIKRSYRWWSGMIVDGRTGNHFLIDEEVARLNKEHESLRRKTAKGK